MVMEGERRELWRTMGEFAHLRSARPVPVEKEVDPSARRTGILADFEDEKWVGERMWWLEGPESRRGSA